MRGVGRGRGRRGIRRGGVRGMVCQSEVMGRSWGANRGTSNQITDWSSVAIWMLTLQKYRGKGDVKITIINIACGGGGEGAS